MGWQVYQLNMQLDHQAALLLKTLVSLKTNRKRFLE